MTVAVIGKGKNSPVGDRFQLARGDELGLKFPFERLLKRICLLSRQNLESFVRRIYERTFDTRLLFAGIKAS